MKRQKALDGSAVASAASASPADGMREQLHAVLSEAELRECVRIPYLALASVEPQRMHGLMRVLARVLPLAPELGHVKRVRKTVGEDESEALDVLLCPPDAVERLGAAERGQVEQASAMALGAAVLVQVPALAPCTRSQFEQWRQLWPIGFSHMEPSTTPAAELSDGDVLYIAAMLDEARALAATEGRPCAAYGDCCGPGVSVGAVIASPSRRVRLAAGATRTGVAGGCRPLCHAVRMAIDALGWAHLQSEVSGRQADGSYLGKGLDVFVTTEPCVMCAMALLHTRVSRVFFVRGPAEPSRGLSGVRVHAHPHLNHHFMAYEVLRDAAGYDQ